MQLIAIENIISHPKQDIHHHKSVKSVTIGAYGHNYKVFFIFNCGQNLNLGVQNNVINKNFVPHFTGSTNFKKVDYDVVFTEFIILSTKCKSEYLWQLLITPSPLLLSKQTFL